MIAGPLPRAFAVLFAMGVLAPHDDPPAKPADPAAEAAKAELERFQGTWTVVSLTIAGKKLEQEKVPKGVVKIEGDEWKQTFNGQLVNTCTIVLRPIAKPAEIDVILNAGRNQGEVSQAIYELEGDTLTLCTNHRGERPKTFVTGERPDKEASLVVYKRQKPKKAEP